MRSATQCRDGRRGWVLPAAALAVLAATGAVEPPADPPVDRTVGGEALAVSGSPLADSSAPALPALDARSWLIADTATGDVLAAFSPHDQRPPASTIKLLTAVATVPTLDLDEPYVATTADAAVEGSKVGLTPEQPYTVDHLLHGLMLGSGNDAAHALAEAAGGQETTIEMMNDEARRLGAFDTYAVTPHGLDAPGQLSSAYDLALIGRRALDDEQLARLARTPTYDFPGLDGRTFQIQNQNRLLGSYDGAIGLKTGYTTNAGHTFVGAAERDGRTLVAVVLGAEGRAEDGAVRLFDWAFGAPDVEPVGHLVTPDEAAAMVREAEQDGDVIGDPLGDYSDALTSPGSNSDGVPRVVWLSLAAAAALGGAGFALRRRGQKHPSGRYASRRP